MRYRCLPRGCGKRPLTLGALLLLLAAAPHAMAASTFGGFRVDERVAQFNLYVGNFLVPAPVTMSADYNYDGSHGTGVTIDVEVWSNGARNTRFQTVPFTLATNRGRAAVRVSYVPEVGVPVNSPAQSERIVFGMYKGGQAFFTQAFDLPMVWPKPFDDITQEDVAAIDWALHDNPFGVGMSTAMVMLVGKTNEGRYFTAIADHAPNSDLVLRRWKVFAANGTVCRQGTNTAINRTFEFDLDPPLLATQAIKPIRRSDAILAPRPESVLRPNRPEVITPGPLRVKKEPDLWWQFATETKREITPENGAKHSIVCLAYANYDLSHVPNKRFFVEMDKLAGVEWPPYVADRGGRRNSLQSIYAAGGVDLQLRSDEGSITDLKNSAPYTLAEMDSFFAAHSNQPAPAGYWHMHCALLTGDTAGNLGVMFRSADRQGFAVFAPQFGGDQAKMLRTTAHEMGHALNMFHSDGDANVGGAPQAGRGHTIMNQTWTLDSDWGYEWGPVCQGHLSGHPLDRIQPNSGHGFGDCIASHPGLY